MIGIRQADGSFYEIMGDAQSGHKRLVLSAARTDQQGVRIDLYRSVDGTVVPEGSLGSISIDDPEGLGYQDIEFRVDLDGEGQLNASAHLPGLPPRTLSVDLSRFRSQPTVALESVDPFLDDLSFDDNQSESTTLDLPDISLDEPRRSDSDILGDEAFASADLDTLDDAFGLEEPLNLDEPLRSDADILGDENLASADLDTLDDFSFEGESPETQGLDAMAAPEAAPMDFDLGDLDEGFGDDPAPQQAPAAAEPAEEWERISLDDMEPMEFLDTGAEISSPSKTPKAPEKPAPKPSADHFSMDDDEPLELGDFDSDLSDLADLPDLGDSDRPRQTPNDGDNDLDQDFLAPPELTEPSSWGQGDLDTSYEETPLPSSKPPKAAKEKPVKEKAPREPAPAQEGSLDKTALVLSLSALSLLVLLILVLLFLNMIKSPAVPKIQPEVQRWKADTTLVSSSGKPQVVDVDLASDPVNFEAESVLEVPQALRAARISLVLEPGETVEDATNRYGAPARVEGNQLFW